MSEETKYYTPAPEDLRIGFELEIQDKVISDVWRSRKVKYPHEISFLIGNQLEAGQIRVPYLTAEQIEAEGFPLMDVNTGFGRFKKGDIELWYSSLHTLTVMFDNDPIFRGYCRCVNDFRLICKMLSIETTKNNAI